MANFKQVIDEIDEVNSGDPHIESVDGKELPHEWIDARRATRWILTLKPEASELLQIAARGHHIARWKIARDSYPMDRGGYLRWRADLKLFHGATVGEIMKKAGYGDAEIAEVKNILLRRDVKGNADMQALEDALCLVFLENEFDALIAKTPEDKMIAIVKKTWAKMSEAGHAAALGLAFSPAAQAILKKSL
jgi:hypothetical protein